MSDERAISSSQSGGQDDFTESDTEAGFEDSAKYDQHKSSLQVTANKLENFWKTVENKKPYDTYRSWQSIASACQGR